MIFFIDYYIIKMKFRLYNANFPYLHRKYNKRSSFIMNKNLLTENQNPPAQVNLNNKVILSANIQKREHYYSFSKHIHTNIELYHILSGECKMDICKETVTCRKQDVILILPNTVHSFYLDCEEPCEFQHIHFKPEFLTKLFFDQVSLLSYLISSLHFYCKIPTDEKTRRLFNAILACNQEAGSFPNAEANLYLMLLLVQILERNPSGIKPFFFESAVQNRYVTFALEYIRENYSKKILISDIAEPLHISARYLSKIFVQHTDLTVLNYINIFRINKSIELMTDTDLSLAEIAVRIGCAGSQHFSKMFHSIIGLSPHKYKQLLKNEK